VNSIVAPYREQLAALCRRYHVRRLAAFGSVMNADFEPDRSDLDFVVEFEALTPAQHADAYFGLLLALEDLFRRRVDLVEEGAIENPYFREAIEKTRSVLYAA
jgi:predicted nucleotidyltransferase